MSQFGSAHRQLVADTNQGTVIPEPKEVTSSNAKVALNKPNEVIGEGQLGNALVSLADTASKPIVEKAKQQRENDAYDAAGTEDGANAVAAAQPVWAEMLFGPNASMRGAQKRIAEDSATDYYLKAQDLLENGGADSWDDETWAKWRDDYRDTEVNKYDNPELRKHVHDQLGKDMQKLERDRGFAHQQYIQQESNETLRKGIASAAGRRDSDMGSPNVMRAQDAEEEYGKSLEKLRTDSGVTDKVWTEAIAQEAMDRLVKGDDSFYLHAQEAGYLDELTYDQQEAVSKSFRLHQMANDEKVGDEIRSLNKSIEEDADLEVSLGKYDALMMTHPELLETYGSRNKVYDDVADAEERNRRQALADQRARERAERARAAAARKAFIQQTKIAKAQETQARGIYAAETGNNQPWAWVNPETGTAEAQGPFTDTQLAIYQDMHLGQAMTGKVNDTLRNADPEHEDREATREELFEVANSEEGIQLVSDSMQANGFVPPQVSEMADGAMQLASNMAELGEGGRETLLKSLNSLHAMAAGNSGSRALMSEEVPDWDKMMMIRKQLRDPANIDSATIAKSMESFEPTKRRSGSRADGSEQSDTPELATSQPDNGEVKYKHEMKTSELTQLTAKAVRALNPEGTVGMKGAWNSLTGQHQFSKESAEQIRNTARKVYANEMDKWESPNNSNREFALSKAQAAVEQNFVVLDTDDGKELAYGIKDLHNGLINRGYSNGTPDMVDYLNENDFEMRRIRDGSGLDIQDIRDHPHTIRDVNGQFELSFPNPQAPGGVSSFLYDLPPQKAASSEMDQTLNATDYYIENIAGNNEKLHQMPGAWKLTGTSDGRGPDGELIDITPRGFEDTAILREYEKSLPLPEGENEYLWIGKKADERRKTLKIQDAIDAGFITVHELNQRYAAAESERAQQYISQQRRKEAFFGGLEKTWNTAVDLDPGAAMVGLAKNVGKALGQAIGTNRPDAVVAPPPVIGNVPGPEFKFVPAGAPAEERKEIFEHNTQQQRDYDKRVRDAQRAARDKKEADGDFDVLFPGEVR